jgi:hypothetical protein
MYGVDTYYLPRALQKEDLIFGEDVVSKFDDYFEIEVFIKNIDGFGGQGDLFRKFGLEVQDQATLLISRSRFDEEVDTELQPPRPREGDLILFPENNALMEVKFVSNEKMTFYQLGEWYVYQIEIQQFAYSHEKLDTGIPEIDQVEEDFSYQFNINLGVGSGVFLEKEEVYQGASLATATAKAIVVTYNIPPNTVRVRDIVGEFVPGVAIKGDTSAANYLVAVADEQDILNNASANNKPLNTEANTFTDFSEDNPFAEEEV